MQHGGPILTFILSWSPDFSNFVATHEREEACLNFHLHILHFATINLILIIVLGYWLRNLVNFIMPLQISPCHSRKHSPQGKMELGIISFFCWLMTKTNAFDKTAYSSSLVYTWTVYSHCHISTNPL